LRNYLKLSLKRKRAGLSELTGTLLMVGITLVAGAAVIGWVNGQASTSESAYGNSVANNVNFLQERFAMVTQTFTGGGVGGICNGGPPVQCTGANFWIYNSGKVGFTLSTLQIQTLPGASSYLNIIFHSVCTTSPPGGTSNCGFTAYQASGATLCSWNAVLPTLDGFYQTGPVVPATLSVNQLAANPYQITMPTGATCSAGALYLYDGTTYLFTFTGIYGNVFSTTLTVNG
jgi:flagellin-like protein